VVLSNLDLKMQEMQAQAGEMSRRQTEEAVRLQVTHARTKPLQCDLQLYFMRGEAIPVG
jgi:hypothetical protein